MRFLIVFLTCLFNEIECFKLFTTVERLEDYKCANCNHLGCTKQYLLEALPKVLCLVLKRFTYTSRGREKINTPILFPPQINFLKKYCNSNLKLIKSYNLKSLISHQGKIPTVGHYTTYSYNSSRGKFFYLLCIFCSSVLINDASFMIDHPCRTMDGIQW